LVNFRQPEAYNPATGTPYLSSKPFRYVLPPDKVKRRGNTINDIQTGETEGKVKCEGNLSIFIVPKELWVIQ
jgi:hypothetical protein